MDLVNSDLLPEALWNHPKPVGNLPTARREPLPLSGRCAPAHRAASDQPGHRADAARLEDEVRSHRGARICGEAQINFVQLEFSIASRVSAQGGALSER